MLVELWYLHVFSIKVYRPMTFIDSCGLFTSQLTSDQLDYQEKSQQQLARQVMTVCHVNTTFHC